MTSRDRMLLINEMAKRQERELQNWKDHAERLRGIFGRLQAFAEQGWFLLGEEGSQDRWLRADSVLEILRAAEMVIGDAPKPLDDSRVHRVGGVTVVNADIEGDRVIPAFRNPLDV